MADPGRAAYERLMAQSAAQGPCGYCGASRAAHRLWDSIDAAQRRHCKATPHQIWFEFGALRPIQRDIRLAYRWARRNHKPLPGRANFPLDPRVR